MSRQLGEVIQGRGSTRRFARDSISLSQFNSILDCSTRGVSADFLRSARASLLDIYIIVNAVEDFPAGSYFFSPQHRGLELLRRGAFREEAGHLCFEQALGADASVVVFFMADLERVLDRYGNRGYRATQLEAGILGGKMYLCTHSLGLGASGITFYDDDVAEFFSPHAAGKSTMFVVTLGVPAQKNRVRPFRSRVAARLDALARGAAKKEDKAALIDGSS
jgi:SagB-type dehydrogenase family enzyme